MAQLRTTDPESLATALLDVLAGGDVTIGYAELGDYASVYNPGTSCIWLNSTASREQQREELLDALRAFATLDDVPRAPRLRLLQGGAA